MSIFKKSNKQAGMSYVELIVVLSIFSLLSGVVIYNYGTFQSKVDIKNLAGDIALKIVEAQKSSLTGLYYDGSVSDWKPAYGVYFDLGAPGGNKEFTYFVDLNNANGYDAGAEQLNTILIKKNDVISEINKCYNDTCSSPVSISDLSINFSRPSSSAVLFSGGIEFTDVSYVQIIVTSPNGPSAQVKVFPSGRIQLDSATTSPEIPGGGGEEEK